MKKRWIFLLLLVAGITFVAVKRGKKAGAADAAKPAGNGLVAVLTAKVEQKDVPVWLTGIGTVQALNTVTVRPRVGGSLDKINFTEGAMVKKGDVLAEIDPRPFQSVIDQAEAKKLQDEAQLANARLEAARFSNLLKTEAVSKQQSDQAAATVSQLEALVASDDASIRAAKLDLDFTTVRAPISGRTGLRRVDAGNLVTANQESGLVVLTELQPISVVFTLPQQQLSVLAAGMKPGAPKLRVEALGDDELVLDEGELELLDNQIDQSTGTLRLKANFKNEKLTLWPGLFVSARVLVDTRRDALVVASEVVQPGLDGQFCYVVKQDQTVEARPVKTGLQIEGATVIDEGLKAGETVVVTGHTKLKPGSKVAPQEKSKAP